MSQRAVHEALENVQSYGGLCDGDGVPHVPNRQQPEILDGLDVARHSPVAAEDLNRQ